MAAMVLCAAATAFGRAQSTESPAPSPSPAPSATPYGEGREPLYDINNDIYTIDRSATLYYYFQENRDGSAKVKEEFRYTRNLWTDNAQLQIRIPFIGRYPANGANQYFDLGNIELGYSYNVKGDKFDHSLAVRAAFPTAGKNVESLDTQLKAFYDLKWKFKGWAISYGNEYDQTVIKPPLPGTSWTSYYEGKLTLPDYAFVNALKGFKISTFYNYRWLFDSGGKFKDALGVTIFGGMNDLALSATDSWGLGGDATALWKYKFEFNATARF
jgi:hypothetical protein